MRFLVIKIVKAIWYIDLSFPLEFRLTFNRLYDKLVCSIKTDLFPQHLAISKINELLAI